MAIMNERIGRRDWTDGSHSVYTQRDVGITCKAKKVDLGEERRKEVYREQYEKGYRFLNNTENDPKKIKDIRKRLDKDGFDSFDGEIAFWKGGGEACNYVTLLVKEKSK
jgi:hypothetical protein